MNIKQAKEEILHTLQAYLMKDELGEYQIPTVRQRPILLMGPPGVGKTQIMEQIAAESGVGLVAYTITHHTRQSAVGLPFIERRVYGGREFSVTEYTMSEILSSVYQMIERTGIGEGIIFLDEINCVSETLAPMMLQFLQCKTFGNQRLPEGWVIVAAGNPPEYNKSVRDFDIVTLDRVKRIDVTADFAVWKEYALRRGLHGAILSYLDIKKDGFYRIENSVDGPQFVTARSWEDLSELLYAYEKLDVPATREMIGEYIQLPAVARDFANYLQLYYKYQKTYHVDEVLRGAWEPSTVSELRAAPFDERLSVMSLLMSRLSENARAVRFQDALCEDLLAGLSAVRERFDAGTPMQEALGALAEARRAAFERRREAGQLDKESRRRALSELNRLEQYLNCADTCRDMDGLRAMFGQDTRRREALGGETGLLFANAFRYLEEALGDSQELVVFVTEITAGYDTAWFVENFGCEAYFRHNRDLLFDDVRHSLRDRIERARTV